MPKKTKREKIISEYRRRLSTVSAAPTQSQESRPQPINAEPAFQFQAHHPKPSVTVSSEDAKEYTIIRKDLLKTVFLAIISVGVELGLYLKLKT